MTQISKHHKKRKNQAACCSDLCGVFEPKFFKALSDPNRVAILARLARCCEPCTVSQISECCPVDISVVSRHLAMLREAGILEAKKQGKEVYYSVRFPELGKRLRSLADAIEACCPSKE